MPLYFKPISCLYDHIQLSVPPCLYKTVKFASYHLYQSKAILERSSVVWSTHLVAVAITNSESLLSGRTQLPQSLYPLCTSTLLLPVCRITVAVYSGCQLDCIWNLSLSSGTPVNFPGLLESWRLTLNWAALTKGHGRKLGVLLAILYQLIHLVTESLLSWLVFDPTYLGFLHRLKTSSSPGIPQASGQDWDCRDIQPQGLNN